MSTAARYGMTCRNIHSQIVVLAGMNLKEALMLCSFEKSETMSFASASNLASHLYDLAFRQVLQGRPDTLQLQEV